MDKPEDHGGGDANSPFCKYCTDAQGNLLPKDQVRTKMVQFYVQKQGKTQEEAEKLTDQLMSNMPAWKGEAGGMVAGAPEPTSSSADEPSSAPISEMPLETPSTPQPTESPASSPPAGEEPIAKEESPEPTTE
ncbi:hypothetical protein A2Z41_00850 [Microgenomates group bacterium RBG_19FT_COMBO_39_10]|nr:MAG: hypothetical protein A2Z41_00850 [Microgenomates group bacterium RBG_19FT_COMBO_39_10]